MAVIKFKDLEFKKYRDYIRVIFLRLFYFDINIATLEGISNFSIGKNSINFKGISDKKARNKFNLLLEGGFRELKSRLYNKKAAYIHQNSGIPLIGTNYFGLIDRGTNIIEIKPITGCNLDCVYCSVDEGKSSKRKVDFVVEKDYLVKELKRLAEFKAIDNIEAHINAQGEPLLYADIIELIKDISLIKGIRTISIDTNGLLLTEKIVDRLIDAGLTRFNLSINSLDEELAKKIANCSYNVKKITEIARYISNKAELIIAPVWVPGINDNEITKLVEFTKSLQNNKHKVSLGIQNCLNYRFGRNPVREMPFERFYSKLRALENEYGIELVIDCSKYDIVKTKPLQKPFRKGEVIKAKVVCPGRIKGEKLAVAKERLIAIPNCYKEGNVKLRITRTKHNIFMGALI